MRPSLLRRNPSLVIIRWHSREARKARDCLPSALPTPPVGGWLSLPSGSGGVSPPVSRRVNPPFLATLGLGGEQRGRRRRPPGPSSLPGCGWEPRCAEETWTGPLLSFGGAVLRGHVTVGVRPPPLLPTSCHGAGLSPFRKAVAPGPRERACCPPGVTHCSIHSLHKYGVPAVCPASRPPRSPARSSAHSLRRVDGNVVGETPPAPPTLWRKPPLGSDAVETSSAAAGLGRRQRGPRPGRAGRGRSAPGPWTLSREGLTC